MIAAQFSNLTGMSYVLIDFDMLIQATISSAEFVHEQLAYRTLTNPYYKLTPSN